MPKHRGRRGRFGFLETSVGALGGTWAIPIDRGSARGAEVGVDLRAPAAGFGGVETQGEALGGSGAHEVADDRFGHVAGGEAASGPEVVVAPGQAHFVLGGLAGVGVVGAVVDGDGAEPPAGDILDGSALDSGTRGLGHGFLSR